MDFKKIQSMSDEEEKIIKMINGDNNILCIGHIQKSLLNQINQKSKILYLNSIEEKDIEVEQITINQYDENIFQKEIDFKIFDVILLSESKEVMNNIDELLINLKKYCQKEAKIIFTIKNFCDIHNRIKILNGELDYITNKNKNIFNLKTINQLINNLGYCIQQMDRVKIDELKLEINYKSDYAISEELIDSIKTDPESLVSDYIIQIKNIENSTDEIRTDEIRKWVSTFSNTIVTQRLKEWFDHYKK